MWLYVNSDMPGVKGLTQPDGDSITIDPTIALLRDYGRLSPYASGDLLAKAFVGALGGSFFVSS